MTLTARIPHYPSLYQDGSGTLMYRPAVNGNSSQFFHITSNIAHLAYKARKEGKQEAEFESMKKEASGSNIQLFLVMDEENWHPYALKVSVLYALKI